MKTGIINVIVLIITFAMTIFAVSVLPDTVGVHFDIHGNPDRFGSKYELLIVPAVTLLLQAILDIVYAVYKRRIAKTDDEREKAAITTNMKQLGIVSVIVSFVMLLLNGFTLYASYSSVNTDAGSIDVLRWVVAILGLMLIALGDRMPKTRTNSIIGFRLPWTMYNDVTWQKSNRFASYVSIIAGVITVVCALIFEGMVIAIILISIIIISALVCTCYAYNVYKKEKDNEN